MPVRVRLKLDRLRELMVRSNLSQNHWAIKIGISRGHWSEIVDGKHTYLSPKTRTQLLEVAKVPFEELFEVDAGPGDRSDPTVQAAVRSRYLIDEEIGHGGMGTVYLARDMKLGRRVALKILSAEAVSGIGVKQFLREIRYTARLQHHNILPLFDAGEAAGHPFYVMPFIRGGSLRDLLERRGRLSLWKTLAIARGVGSALQYAHDHHLLHCDVKPENVLIDDEHVYVADFGVSRAIHAEVFEWGRRREIDSSAGTPAYVSPEQASGERQLDARSDVYSLACMTFEMLAGRPPFTGRNSMEIVAQRFATAVPDPRALAPEIPRAVATSVERAMAFGPHRRTATARGLVQDLEAGSRRGGQAVRAVRRAAFMAGAVRRFVSGGRPRPPRRFWIGGFMEGVWQDVRQAVGSLRRVPSFPLMAVLTLALGIGANTAVFTVVNAVLLRPLPYDRPDELVMMWEVDRLGKSGGVDTEWTVAPANYAAWTERTSVFVDIAAFNYWRPTLSGDGPAEDVLGSVVTPNLFAVLGVSPLLGSGFTAVAESVLLTAAGGIVGLGAVKAATGFLHGVQDQYISSVADIRVDVSVVVFMLVLALGTGVLFGLLPVLQSSRTDLRTALTEEGARTGVTRRARRLRGGLVVTEVLVATVLAVGAGLMARSFSTLIGMPKGFESDRVLTFSLTLPRARYEEREQVRVFHDLLSPKIGGLPGVQDVALVSDLPFTTENRFLWVDPVEDQRPPGDWTLSEYRAVGPGYFRTMGIPFLSGRDFRPADGREVGDADVPVLINEEMAARFWPEEDTIGKRFHVGDFSSPASVIGVVSDILDDGFDGEPEARFYVPFAYLTPRSTAMVVRSAVDPASLAAASAERPRGWMGRSS